MRRTTSRIVRLTIAVIGLVAPLLGISVEANDSFHQNALAICYEQPEPGSRVLVTSASALRSALENAEPGLTIEVGPGAYSGEFRVERSGSSQDPIILKASGTVTFSGKFQITADHVVVEGFEFNGATAGVAIHGGSFNRVTRNLFRGFAYAAVQIYVSGDQNRIDHNEFRDASTQRTNSTHAFAIYVALGRFDYPKNNRFDHNYLHDFPPTGATNASEAIHSAPSIAQYSTDSVFDHNLLDNTESGAVYWIAKTSGDLLYRNTIVNNRGYFSRRAGNDSKFIANWFENNGDGIRVAGGNHQFIGNYLRGPSTRSGRILLLRGDATWQQWLQCEQQTNSFAKHGCGYDYSAAGSILLRGNNTAEIQIGTEYDSWSSAVVTDTTIEDDKSDSIILGLESGTSISPTSSAPYPTAIKLSPQEVGRSVADKSCQAATWLLPPRFPNVARVDETAGQTSTRKKTS